MTVTGEKSRSVDAGGCESDALGGTSPDSLIDAIVAICDGKLEGK
jgi:hypothetical protein